MTSLRAQGLRFARGGALLSAVIWAGCGITVPGNFKIGDDQPGVIGIAGRGGVAGRGGSVAGTGAAGGRAGVGGSPAPTGTAGTSGRGAAGRGGGVAGGPSPGTAGVSGKGWAGVGGVGGTWGGVAGTWGVAGTGAIAWDRDGDGASAREDCNDLDPSISPYAEDYCCDGVDYDCDTQDSPRGTACRCAPDVYNGDFDGDGWSINNGDCNDRDANFHPKNRNEGCCDGLDHNCDGQDDPPGAPCDCPVDADGDGFVPGAPNGWSDCDDFNWSVNPGTPEICDDGIDNNCNGIYDWNDGCAPVDADGDGYPSVADCNDYNRQIHPGMPEICGNRQDDNCDGVIDGGRSGECDQDRDGDGYGASIDCNDRDASVWPGAYEDCFDGRDGNCDGRPDSEDYHCRGGGDVDRDGYPANSDCDDYSPHVYPGAIEVCGDSLDNNCDGLIDPYPQCTDQMIDWDRDGFPWSVDCNDGSSQVFPGSPYEQCCDILDSNCDGQDGPPGVMCSCDTMIDNDGDGYAVGFTDPGKADCNDQDPQIHPGMPENCSDRRDNNCNGRMDSADEACGVPPV